MRKDEITVYRELQEHMDTFPIRFPKRKDDAEIRLLKRLFTPQEAKIAIKLRYTPRPIETVDDIYPRVKDLGVSKQELKDTLEAMAKKGLIFYRRDGDTKYYANAPWVIGIYEFQVGKITPELVADIKHFYSSPPTEEVQKTGIPQMRTIPVGESIRRRDSIAHYDSIQQLIEQSDGPFIVVNCICREEKDVGGEPCKATDRRELCFGVGDFSSAYLDFGWGREVSKEEMLNILEQNKSEGLVLQPSNTQNLEFVCSCCGCCCGILESSKAAPRPVDYFTTNYFAMVDSELCTGCGTCVDLCQMEAATLEGDAVNINLDRCIGCGVCIANCPSDALELKTKEKLHVPPKNSEELYSQIDQRRKELDKGKN
jgi:NAD-dependent dihydropyrimidine dehydrogenase PreA subunit